MVDFDGSKVKIFKVPNSNTIQLKGQGTLILKPNEDKEIVISDVSYIPHATLNILSLGQLTKFGYDGYVSKDNLRFINVNDRRCISVAENLGGKNICV